jgi:response regulator receiver domain protein
LWVGDFMRVLVVDDEKLIRDVIKEYLLLENIKVDEAENGLQAVDEVKHNDYDIIIMDIMMPKMDGYTACREIKKIKDIPFIMLSARGEEYDKLIGFDLGIDDYVTKPFSPKELVARIKVITKRKDVVNNIFEIEGVRLDDVAHDVYVDGKKIYLTPKEYELLKYFFDNKNIALSRENLLNHVWGFDFYGDDRTVDTHVKTLRKHLGKYKDLIVTVRGMGYKLEYEEKKEN